MSGILDSKSRVIDTVITTEGRRQLAMGGIDIQYVSFTDGATFYKADVASGSQDATQRIYLEACQLPQDDIVFRADDDGNLHPFRNTDGVPIAAGRILNYSFTPLTSTIIEGHGGQVVTALQGDEFVEKAETVLASAAQNFRNMYLIATEDKIFEDKDFAAGPDQVTCTITGDRPISDPNKYTTHVSSLDSIFSDPRFSTHPNFKYLPPINKTNDKSLDKSDYRATRPYHMACFTPWGRTHLFGLTYNQVMSELQYYKSLGYEQVIHFDPTSRDNHLVGQFFERSFNTLRKLDVIDCGIFQTGNRNAPVAHIFFVGKVIVDDKGTDTFLHLFTLVFE
jgi:hypothetical protein